MNTAPVREATADSKTVPTDSKKKSAAASRNKRRIVIYGELFLYARDSTALSPLRPWFWRSRITHKTWPSSSPSWVCDVWTSWVWLELHTNDLLVRRQLNNGCCLATGCRTNVKRTTIRAKNDPCAGLGAKEMWRAQEMSSPGIEDVSWVNLVNLCSRWEKMCLLGCKLIY